MDKLIHQIFIDNWQRKIVALGTALIIWLFVNSSISENKTIPNVPIRISNLPPDKTIVGLLPNRMLSKRVTLTLTGSKDVIQDIEPGDLEVLLDASVAGSDEWVVNITKKNLVSLNPDIDLLHNISLVEHSELVLKLSSLVTAKIPVRISYPAGEAPSGYEFLDIWPQSFLQTVSGPEEEIQALSISGLDLTFNLSDISKADLDALKSQHGHAHDDEISFSVPEKWLKVAIPFQHNALEDINDPDAQYLRINFLKKQFLPIEKEIPIRVFYPIKHSDAINAKTYPLAVNEQMRVKNDITIFLVPLYLRNVSRLFLNLISDNLELTILAAPQGERTVLQWTLEVVDAHEIEDVYVAYFHANSSKSQEGGLSKRREIMLRTRFREYMHRLTLFKAPDQKFRLESKLGESQIIVSAIR